MKLKLFYLVPFYLAATVMGLAQSAKIDSLKERLATTQTDSLRIRTLSKLAVELVFRDYRTSKKYADELLALAEKNNWNWAKSVAYSRQGYLSTVRGDHRGALEFDNRNLKIVTIDNDSTEICKVYNDVGNDYMELGEYEEAFFYLTKSIEVARKINDYGALSNASHNLGIIYSKLGRIDLALSNLEEASKFALHTKDIEFPAYADHEIGNAYLRDGKYDQASKYLYSSLATSKKLGISIVTPRVYQSLGELYATTGDFPKALSYYDSAILDYQKNDNTFGVTDVQLGKSKIFLKQNKLDQAVAMALLSQKAAEKLKAQILLLESFEVLSRSAETRGDYKAALNYSKQASQTQDSLYNVNVMSQVFENEYQMRSQKKDLELESLRKMREQSMSEIKRQQFIRNIFAVVFGLTMVLLYSVYKSGRRKVEINDLLLKHQQETEKRTMELEELNKVKDKFFSIISHDLRSPINSLAGLLDLMEKDQIKAEELPSLTREMRVQFNHTKNLINNLLDWTLLQMNKVAIKKEKLSIKAIVDENIKLLSSMSTKHTNFVNEVTADMQALADNNMISLIVRNLILNGIKFTDSGGLIKIAATKNDKEITVSVTDNGVGISDDVQKVLFEKTTGYSTRGTANEKGTGLGLILCKEFIERNGGRIWLESKEGQGSTFYVTVPVV